MGGSVYHQLNYVYGLLERQGRVYGAMVLRLRSILVVHHAHRTMDLVALALAIVCGFSQPQCNTASFVTFKPIVSQQFAGRYQVSTQTVLYNTALLDEPHSLSDAQELSLILEHELTHATQARRGVMFFRSTCVTTEIEAFTNEINLYRTFATPPVSNLEWFEATADPFSAAREDCA